MKKILFLLLIPFSLTSSYSQNLYAEKFDDCKLSKFGLDSGETKAQPVKNFTEELLNNLDKSVVAKVNGSMELQILIDENGKICLLSAVNQTNISSKKLKLQKAVNNTSDWQPALSKNKKREHFCVIDTRI